MHYRRNIFLLLRLYFFRKSLLFGRLLRVFGRLRHIRGFFFLSARLLIGLEYLFFPEYGRGGRQRDDRPALYYARRHLAFARERIRQIEFTCRGGGKIPAVHHEFGNCALGTMRLYLSRGSAAEIFQFDKPGRAAVGAREHDIFLDNEHEKTSEYVLFKHMLRRFILLRIVC